MHALANGVPLAKVDCPACGALQLDTGLSALKPRSKRTCKCGHTLHRPSLVSNPLAALRPVLVSAKLQFTDVQSSVVDPRLSALALEPGWLASVAEG